MEKTIKKEYLSYPEKPEVEYEITEYTCDRCGHKRNNFYIEGIICWGGTSTIFENKNGANKPVHLCDKCDGEQMVKDLSE